MKPHLYDNKGEIEKWLVFRQDPFAETKINNEYKQKFISIDTLLHIYY